ncbi:MAG: nonstructural protein [Microviridae sp.]|nr:MAG: nonstructural protein [Microviridae sp.]
MEKVIFSLFDVRAELFHDPVTVVKRGVIIRDLASEVNRNVKDGETDRPLASYPGEFELWQLAIFDSDTGVVMPAKEKVCVLSDLVASKE